MEVAGNALLQRAAEPWLARSARLGISPARQRALAEFASSTNRAARATHSTLRIPDSQLTGGLAALKAAPASGCRSQGQMRRARWCCQLAAGGGKANVDSLWDEQGPSDVNPVDSEDERVTAERQVIFNNIAPMYDQLNDWLSLGQHRIWKRMAVTWSKAKAGDRVLDVCCGSGDLAFLLAQRVGRQGKVTGLDFAAEQLAVANSRQLESLSASRVPMEWIKGDALALPFGNSSFDAVTMGYGLRNVADISRALREIHRVLKRGSAAAILDFNKPTNVLVALLQGAMLDNVVVPVARQFGVEKEYEYLRPSIERFPGGQEQVSLAKEAGFAKAVHYEIAGGLMGVLVASK